MMRALCVTFPSYIQLYPVPRVRFEVDANEDVGQHHQRRRGSPAGQPLNRSIRGPLQLPLHPEQVEELMAVKPSISNCLRDFLDLL